MRTYCRAAKNYTDLNKITELRYLGSAPSFHNTNPRVVRTPGASLPFRLARSLQQEEGDQRHSERERDADGEGGLRGDPEAGDRLRQRAKHDGQRDGRPTQSHHSSARLIGRGAQVDAAHRWLDKRTPQSC